MAAQQEYRVCGWGRHVRQNADRPDRWMDCGSYPDMQTAENNATMVLQGIRFVGYAFTKTKIVLVDKDAPWSDPE